MISPLAALILTACLLLLWLVSLALRDASIIDVFWGPGYALLAWICAYERGFDLDPARWLLLIAVSVWALRLGAYLGWRNLVHYAGEDRRYQAMRARIGQRFGLLSLITVFGLQGALITMISTPVQTALTSTGPASPALVVVGALLWSIGLSFEAIGDAQLARFKRDPQNADAVMDRGLWRYTRHPNYFGDFLVWWGHFAIALGVGAPWWTVVSPVIMTILLTRISGVPLLEKDLTQRRRGYAEYVRRTSAFFPRPPRP
ncbi:DUF1295 domain-containing protein [Pseudenhygromyxa sp. WMMC2535]|uniref:DUF1295 domain-containing protein n=1 Tax=Pseudenhygromyxa sp. WMMC2535 TaxID=2712867 RepID=UPI001552B3FD|nr:DUF1295 domain-containing protein [Pseudenhygromyxa sp. WMMC2535]NVB40161.1 DUF1295 domain-containing protein [Pseudenhygromyxa sp. WMMC2535]